MVEGAAEFSDDFISKLDPQQQMKVNQFVTNFNVSAERVETLFLAEEYNMGGSATVPEILREIQEKLVTEQNETHNTGRRGKQMGGRMGATKGPSASAKVNNAVKSKDYVALTTEKILQLIDVQKQERWLKTKDQERVKRLTRSVGSHSMPGGIRGQIRESYNQGVKAIPGLYNESCQVEIKVCPTQ